MKSEAQLSENRWELVLPPLIIGMFLMLIKWTELQAINDFRHGSDRPDIAPALFLSVAAAFYGLGLLLWCSFTKLVRPELPWWHRIRLYVYSSLIMAPFSLSQTWLLTNDQHLPFVVTTVVPKIIHLMLFTVLILKARGPTMAPAR